MTFFLWKDIINEQDKLLTLTIRFLMMNLLGWLFGIPTTKYRWKNKSCPIRNDANIQTNTAAVTKSQLKPQLISVSSNNS